MGLNGNRARGPQQGIITYEISKSQEISPDSKDFGIRFHKILSSEISGFQTRFHDFASDFKVSAKISYRISNAYEDFRFQDFIRFWDFI